MIQGTPAFMGLTLHLDKNWGFAFWYPSEWFRFDLPDRREGVLYAPAADDYATSFSVEVKDIGTKVTEDDVADLEAGFLEGLRSLPECQIESQEHWVVGALVGLEAKYTFQEGEFTRRRWVRLLYEGRRQFHVVAQGATSEEYEYWLPMLFEMMMTLQVD
jgi:hypothetical protein